MDYKKLVLNKPIGLERKDIPRISKNYSFSDKIDGQHMLLILEKDKHPYFIDINNTKLEQNEIFWTSDRYILEGEYYENNFYCFDILFQNNSDIRGLTFQERYELILHDKLINSIPNLIIKKFTFPKKENEIYTLISNKKSHDVLTDGIIFMPINFKYTDKRAVIYKWKPKELLSVDFLCKKVDKTTYEVYCAMNIRQFLSLKLNRLPQYSKKKMPEYFPILFRPTYYLRDEKSLPTDYSEHLMITNASDSQYDTSSYDNKIVECILENKSWIPMRIREDKTKMFLESGDFAGPNNWKTCLSIFREALNPVTLEELNGFAKGLANGLANGYKK